MTTNNSNNNSADYDGLSKKQNKHGALRIYNIYKALEQENPRNIFLNGHMHIELECDYILLNFFFGFNDSKQRAIFSKFLKSRDIDFFKKVNLLRSLGEISHNEKKIEICDGDMKTSLLAVGAIRNAFHHNLDYDDALRDLRSGTKFSYLNKNVSTYTNVEKLKEAFKKEIIILYEKLNNIDFILKNIIIE